MTKMRIECDGYAIVDKNVSKVSGSSSSGRVHVPGEWAGKKVRVILIEPLDED